MEKAFLVRGRVQGVGFRWWTRSRALRLGLAGTVRNRADGSVEVQVRGPAEPVAELQRLLHLGPPGAGVTSVDELRETSEDRIQEDDFTILH